MNLLSASLQFAVRWNHSFHSSAQVDLGMFSTALVNAQQASSTLSNRASFSCFFTCGDRKKSQGERSGKNTVSAAAAAPCSHWESQVLFLLCAHWHCHEEETGHRVLSLEGDGTKHREPLGDYDASNSPLWLSICPQGERWQHGSIFRRNRQPFSFVRCVIFSVFGEGTRPETARPMTRIGFRIISTDPSPSCVSTSQVNF